MYGQDRRLGIGFLGVDFSFAHLGTSQYCINIKYFNTLLNLKATMNHCIHIE